MQRVMGRAVKLVFLVLPHRAEVLVALLDNNAAGDAGANAAAGVPQVHAVVQGNIEQGFPQTFPFIRKPSGREFNGVIAG